LVKFTVCIPTVRPTTVAHTIQSIIAQTWADWELVLVGQGNDPDLPAMGERAQMADRRIRYLHLSERGLSRARNAGMRAASGEVVAFIDDDCTAAPNWLETLAVLFGQHPDAGFIGGALIAPPISRWKLEMCLSHEPAELIFGPSTDQNPPPVWQWWVGANFAVRRSVADQIGGFDEYLGAGTSAFPAGEDIDYFMRLAAAGVVMLASPAPIAYHTYGTRRGIRQTVGTMLAYARGNGGVDAKLTLAGNPHGRRSASQALKWAIADAIRRGKVHRLPMDLLYRLHYRAAYQQCLREFSIGSDGFLHPIHGRRYVDQPSLSATPEAPATVPEAH
jgi:glycosyltransferase involved in cell wall biosynthesis